MLIHYLNFLCIGYASGYGTISGWKESWSAAPISLDINTVGERTLTLNLRVAKSLDNGVVELICPIEICSLIQQSVTIEGGKDVSVDFNVTIPSAGVYGPFGVRTRSRVDTPPIDVN